MFLSNDTNEEREELESYDEYKQLSLRSKRWCLTIVLVVYVKDSCNMLDLISFY